MASILTSDLEPRLLLGIKAVLLSVPFPDTDTVPVEARLTHECPRTVSHLAINQDVWFVLAADVALGLHHQFRSDRLTHDLYAPNVDGNVQTEPTSHTSDTGQRYGACVH